MLEHLHKLCHQILSPTLKGKYHYHSYFTEEEVGSEKWNNLTPSVFLNIVSYRGMSICVYIIDISYFLPTEITKFQVFISKAKTI